MESTAYLISDEDKTKLEQAFGHISLHINDLKQTIPQGRHRVVNAYEQYVQAGLGILKRLETRPEYSDMLDHFTLQQAKQFAASEQ